MQDEQPPCGCKVGRAAAHDLGPEINDRLRRQWVGEDGEARSLRELERYFNRALLERRLSEADVEVLDGEVENFYRLLSGDASKGMETQVRRQLERNGLDVDALLDDFVSHQTIYRHLTNCLGVNRERSRTEAEQVEKERRRVSRLQNKAEVVSDDVLTRLRQRGALSLGTFDVIVNFRVACEDCGMHREIVDVLEDRGCDCRPDGSDA